MTIPVFDLGSVSETGLPFRFRDYVFGVGNDTLRVPTTNGPRCSWSDNRLQCSGASDIQSFLVAQANNTFDTVAKIPVVGAVFSGLLGWAAEAGRRNNERAAREAFRTARRHAAIQAATPISGPSRSGWPGSATARWCRSSRRKPTCAPPSLHGPTSVFG